MKTLTFVITYCFLSLMLTVPKVVCGQQVIASAGATYQTAHGSINWTLGEPITETIGTDYILTQGFHQSRFVVTAAEPGPGSFNVFPNPFEDVLQIHASESDIGSIYRLLNTNGNEIDHGTVTGANTQVPMARYSQGVYVLMIIHSTNKSIKIFKVIKK